MNTVASDLWVCDPRRRPIVRRMLPPVPSLQPALALAEDKQPCVVGVFDSVDEGEKVRHGGNICRLAGWRNFMCAAVTKIADVRRIFPARPDAKFGGVDRASLDRANCSCISELYLYVHCADCRASVDGAEFTDQDFDGVCAFLCKEPKATVHLMACHCGPKSKQAHECTAEKFYRLCQNVAQVLVCDKDVLYTPASKKGQANLPKLRQTSHAGMLQQAWNSNTSAVWP